MVDRIRKSRIVLKEKSLSRINIHKTHPNLYRCLMILSIMKISLGMNFFLFVPTFQPLGIRGWMIASVFSVLGLLQMFFLNITRNLRMIRILLAISISFLLFWGTVNTAQFFAGKASLQLAILYVAIAVVQIPLLVEAPINPLTEKKEKGKIFRGDSK